MALPFKKTDENEDLPEDGLTEEEAEDLFQPPAQDSTGQVVDLRRPTANVKGTEKPVKRLSREQTWMKGQEIASKMIPENSGYLGRALGFGRGLKSAINFGQKFGSNPKPSKDEKKEKQAEANKKIAKEGLKTTKALGAFAASSGVNLLALGSAIYHGALAGIAFTKTYWREALIALIIAFLPFIVVLGIFVVGIINLSPGTKGGTTFPQPEIAYDSLLELRAQSAGEQSAKAKSLLNQNVTTDLLNDLQKIRSDIDNFSSVSQENKDLARSLIDQTIADISAFVALSSEDQRNEAGLAKSLTIVQSVNQIISHLALANFGPPSESGFVQLPESQYYVRKAGKEVRQWGQKELVFLLTLAGQRFNEKYANYRLRIGDISCSTGGYMPTEFDCQMSRSERDQWFIDHPTTYRTKSHKCGLEADITVTPTGQNITDDIMYVGKAKHNSAEGQEMARSIAEILFGLGVDRIDFNSKASNRFTYYRGHDNHLHIRLPGAWDYPDCINTEEQAP